MSEEIINKIKSRGYWRINFQPISVENIASLATALEIVKKSSVTLRGWDYPHIPKYQNENEALYPSNNHYVAWCNWGVHKEYWRIYKSQQFILLRALTEDWYQEDAWYNDMTNEVKPNETLSMIGSLVYELTETLEFLSRLGQNGLYKKGVRVSISLHNTTQRSLRIDDRNRLPFAYPRITNAPEIRIEEEYSIDDIIQRPLHIANTHILTIMDTFGFNPDPNSIIAEQKKISS